MGRSFERLPKSVQPEPRCVQSGSSLQSFAIFGSVPQKGLRRPSLLIYIIVVEDTGGDSALKVGWPGDGSKPLSVYPARLLARGWRHSALRPTWRSRAGRRACLDLLRQGWPFHQIRRRRHALGAHPVNWRLCRFCSIADPRGPPKAALPLERGLSSARRP